MSNPGVEPGVCPIEPLSKEAVYKAAQEPSGAAKGTGRTLAKGDAWTKMMHFAK